MKSERLKLTLIVVGSAIAGILLFIAVLGTILYFKFNDSYSEPYEKISTPPEISLKDKFHGTTGSHRSGFDSHTKKVLDNGNASFIGNITSDGKPVVGLKICLALNDSIYSQWATTDSNGRYEIRVPPGSYSVDGYKLDHYNTNKTLGGKIDYPYNSHSTGIIKLEEGQKGRALDLEYVNPVVNISPKGEFSLSKPVNITWDTYLNAKYYQLQIIEQKNVHDFKLRNRLFKWKERPIVNEPSFDLIVHGIALKKDYFYFIEITALDNKMRMLSTSKRSFYNFNFKVVD